MSYGIRLRGNAHDLATLHTLAQSAPTLVTTPWIEVLPGPGVDARGAVLTSPRVDVALAQTLRARGVEVVRIANDPPAVTLTAVRPAKATAPEVWSVALSREAASLVEAVRPVPVVGDPIVDEACFWIPLTGDGAQRTLERLLALRRDDVTVAEVHDPSGERVMLVRAPNPPMYLLMRAREEPAEGVVAFARVGDGALWVQWGFTHPLAQLAAQSLLGGARAAFVDGTGAWRFAPAGLAYRTVYDALTPTFEARRVELTPAQGETRFRIRLRLGAGPVTDPELWILDAEQFLAMEPLLDALSADEVARFTVARTDGPRGPTYVLQEIVRPNVPRLASRVSDLLGVTGFTRAQGTDNLYLPVARRLLPVMRRDELRTLLQLDRHRAVVVTEDGDGPTVVSVGAVDDVSLSKWIDYVATDRRVELDRLAEEAVFDWPEITVEKPPRPRALERDDDASSAPKPPKSSRRDRPRYEEEGARNPTAEALPEVSAALREEIRALETTLAAGGVDDAATWRALGDRKLRVTEPDDACACLEAAMFYGAPDVDTAALLASQRSKLAARTDLVELAASARLAPAEAAFLGARVIELTLRGDAFVPQLDHEVVRIFQQPDLPVSRRVAWTVLRALHDRTRDTLGLTRTREKVLGGLNERGLAETSDMPRFVRYALALSVEGDVAERARVEQIAALEDLWYVAQTELVRELEPKGAYLRLIFALGFTRIGAPQRAKDVADPVDSELGVHEVPNRVLYKLYQSRVAHIATRGDDEAWKREVDAALGTVKEARTRDRVEWLRKRSEWLRTAAPTDAQPALRPAVEKLVAAAETAPEPALLADALTRVMDQREHYDYEVVAVIDRLLRAAMRSGNDSATAAVLAVATRRLAERIKIAGHRARTIGSCIRAAATLGDADQVDRLLDEVVTLASAPTVPSVRELLDAVRPGLAALRRLGAGESARRFLDALAPVAARAQKGSVQLRAALADGYLQLRDEARAEELIERALRDTLEGSLDHVERYESGVAVLAALRHWPLAARALRCRALLLGLDRFTDTFTASTSKLYETHKVLIAERIIDAMVDDVTFRGDKVQAFLDEEEQAIRRKILADWRQRCGT